MLASPSVTLFPAQVCESAPCLFFERTVGLQANSSYFDLYKTHALKSVLQ